MVTSLLHDLQYGTQGLAPRADRRTRPRNGRWRASEGEPAFVSWDPPIYIIEVTCARHRTIIRVLRALTVVASFALAWFVGLTIGRV